MATSFGTRLVLLGLAGGAGALGRYVLSSVCHRVLGSGFPWGVLVVNLLGCFLFGMLFVWMDQLFEDKSMHLILLTGFLGAFTTFSTFVFDTVQLMEQSQYMAALANLALHNFLGIVMLYGGFVTARLWV